MSVADPYPDNGFVDADGRLTAAGREAVDGYLRDYPVPLLAISSMQASRNGHSPRKMYVRVLAMVRERRLEMEDVNAEINFSLSKGVRRFDPAKAAASGASLKTYLSYWVLNGVSQLVDRTERAERLPTAAIGNGRESLAYGGVVLDHTIPDRSPAPDGSVSWEPFGGLQAAVGRLPMPYRRVVERTYGAGESSYEVAAALGVSRQSVNQRLQAVRESAAVRLRMAGA